MSFLRVGDTSAHDPRTLHPLDTEGADERTVDEVFGFSVRLACEAGSKETDRFVTRPMVFALAGNPARGRRLMDMLVDAGVWEVTTEGWALINDSAYLHLRAQDEIDKDRIRGRDSRDDHLVVPARLRDGDNCRYCGDPVNWRDRKSLKGATWEHVNIANQPTKLHEFVVACFACNREPSSRAELRPAPANPVYGPLTRDYITKRLGRWPTKARIAEIIAQANRSGAENAAGIQRAEEELAPSARTSKANAVSHARPASAPILDEKPQAQNGPEPGQIPTSSDDHLIGGLTDLDLPGRDGYSRVGSDQVTTGTKPRPSAGRGKRGRRGGRHA